MHWNSMHALLKISHTNWGNAHKSMLADTYILGHCIPTTWYARVKKKRVCYTPTHSKLLIIINYYTPCRFQCLWLQCCTMRKPSALARCSLYPRYCYSILSYLFCVGSNKHYTAVTATVPWVDLANFTCALAMTSNNHEACIQLTNTITSNVGMAAE